MKRLSDLRGAKVRTLDGDTLGRVHEVECDEGKIVALACGPSSLIERLTAKKKGRRIPWECVLRIEPGKLVVTADPPRRMVTRRASQTPQGTRPPSARPSKR